VSFDLAPSGPARLILQKAGYDGGWTLQPEGTVPAALDAPPWMTLRSQNAPGQIALAIAPPGYALRTTPPVLRRLAEEGLGTPEADHLRFETIITLRAACLRAWHLFRALPDAPEAAFEADLKREGQSWSGPTSQDLDPSCATTREAQVRLRVGQSTFRAALDDYWGGRCPLTGITDRAMLRASHIVPWAECKSDGQRLDVFNGLLLAAHWDAAFDAFLVSFDDEGRVLASPKLSEAGSRALGLTTAPPITLAQDHAAPLAWHRARMDEIAIRR
jgi:hypothetical protein